MTREEAIKILKAIRVYECYPKSASEETKEAIDMAIEALSAAEPKTGEWVLKGHLWECDQCGCRINRAKPLKGNIWNYHYCPNCGTRMLGEDGEA